MSDRLTAARALLGDLVGENADAWDRAGLLPDEVLRKLAAQGILCAQVPAEYGGIGASSLENGEFTAYAGSLCSSLRSVMTSQGMAAWTVQRLGTLEQRRLYLGELASGRLAAVGFSEPDAGSDLSAMAAEIRRDGDEIVLDGEKKWVTAAAYADLLLIVGRHEDGVAFAAVPATAPGVHVERVADPMGCRAAGHANLRFDAVRLPAANLLGGTALPLPLVVTTALSYGRMSVAWGCVGILRACLDAATRHAAGRRQSGKPLAEHQLVARHLAELLVSEQTATRVCEHASRSWDAGSPDMVIESVLAKHTSAGHAARGAASAVQVLASAGAQDGHVVARAYRDAKLMEIIEGSNEICQTILARHALTASR
ncbi:acyl-CoA dehydrogenase family protein [Streptomyces sp. NPDC050658]|uniref:acyl-CoA dehydrogenase family protein n=1 Tax=unclassified Streptomyces TaxID=2593676 RepID=UPI003414889F